ncbi:MAG: endonuclease/exonuclease/phosphatase family protein [Candidatus Eremiobacteraeota bacterium]|nr:endonuclease/exonuclease/phosphatase family protein [Candidatus Eremiobacteraeota bacterium]
MAMSEISPNVPSQLRIVSYNLEALGQDAPAAEGAKKRENMAKTIEELDADIVINQEAPNEADYVDFSKSDLKGKYPYTHFFKTNDPSKHHLGIMSKFPITETQSHTDEEFPIHGSDEKMTFLRDAPETEIQVGPYALRIIDVHFKADPYFKSRKAKDPDKMQLCEDKRVGEAEKVIDLIAGSMKRMPSKLYIVAGDMNETPTSPAIQTLTHNTTAPLIDSFGDSPEISHPAAGKRFDYIMLSPEMSQGLVQGSARVYHSTSAENGSDHLPISLTIDMDDLGGEKKA